MTLRRTLPVLVLLLLVAFWLRVAALGEKAVWWDEAWSVWAAQQPFAQTTEITARDVHPPLYQWALHLWVRAAGISEFAVRYLSVLSGLIATATVYPLTRRLMASPDRPHLTLRAALLATFFIALSAFHIRWSQETRMYALASCFSALACYAYLRLTPRWSGWWILLPLAGAATALTHYLGAFVLVILNLHWLITLRTRPRAFHWRWLVAMIAAGVILLLWIAFAITRTRSGGAEVSAQPAFIFQLAATLIAVGESVNVEQYTLTTLIVLVLLLVGLILHSRRRPQSGLFILLMMLFPPLAIFILSLPNRFYHPRPEERYLMIFIPAAFAGVGIALDHLRQVRRWIGVVAVMGLFALYGASYWHDLDGRYYRDDYATLVRTVSLLAQPDEPIYFISGDRYPLILYHLNRTANGYSPIAPQGFELSGDNPEATMQRLFGSLPRFWLIEIERSLGDPRNEAIRWLDLRFERVMTVPANYNGLTLYARAGVDHTLPQRSEILMPVVKEARPGDVVRVGVPAGVPVEVWFDNLKTFDSPAGKSWHVVQFPIYKGYPNGDYQLRVGQREFTFHVTHAQPYTPFWGLGEDAAPISFGPISLFDYGVSSTRLRPGETIEVTLKWKSSLGTLPFNYTVFAQLLGPYNPATNGPLWAGQDGYPAETPTTAWWMLHPVSETRRLTIPANAPPGTYVVQVGLYRLETGERLKRPDGNDAAVVAEIEVTR